MRVVGVYLFDELPDSEDDRRSATGSIALDARTGRVEVRATLPGSDRAQVMTLLPGHPMYQYLRRLVTTLTEADSSSQAATS